MASTATTGVVKWAGAFERHQDETTDLDTDDFGPIITATASPPSINGAPQYTELTFSNAQIDGLLQGESFRFKLTRQASDAADTMLGDAELLRIELREAP